MVACGPFTVNNELSYEALKDLIAQVKREKPHALILGGPFVSQNHEDIVSGDLRCRNPENGELLFMDYDQLFNQIMNYIYTQLSKECENTEIIIVPSTNEISHIHPLPQPKMNVRNFEGTKMR